MFLALLCLMFLAEHQKVHESFLFFKRFSMKYLISLSEFVPNGKRNYYQLHFHANTRCYYGRWKLS
jgi:hypothetical protein